MNNDNNDEIKIDLDEDLNTDLNSDDTDIDTDEDFISEEESENPKNYIKKLKDEIKSLKKEKTDILTLWQKDKADFINLRRRDEESKLDMIKFSNQSLISEIIPIIDGYEQAKSQPGWAQVDEVWRKGVEVIIEKIYSVLKKFGVTEYGNVGDLFDPNIYEALGQEITTEKDKDNTVSNIMQKGYKMHDKVIRVSLVKVYHFEE